MTGGQGLREYSLEELLSSAPEIFQAGGFYDDELTGRWIMSIAKNYRDEHGTITADGQRQLVILIVIHQREFGAGYNAGLTGRGTEVCPHTVLIAEIDDLGSYKRQVWLTGHRRGRDLYEATSGESAKKEAEGVLHGRAIILSSVAEEALYRIRSQDPNVAEAIEQILSSLSRESKTTKEHQRVPFEQPSSEFLPGIRLIYQCTRESLVVYRVETFGQATLIPYNR